MITVAISPTRYRVRQTFFSFGLDCEETFNTMASSRRGFTAGGVAVHELRFFGLTLQESHIMHWLIQGKRDSEIAQILNSKTRTVEKHTQHIFTKLGVETRTAAAPVPSFPSFAAP
jgi:DNA-binding CsgD family transcriptional regulator